MGFCQGFIMGGCAALLVWTICSAFMRRELRELQRNTDRLLAAGYRRAGSNPPVPNGPKPTPPPGPPPAPKVHG